MEIYEYKNLKWTIKQTGNLIELRPFGVNGGYGPKFGERIFAELLASKEIILCKK